MNRLSLVSIGLIASVSFSAQTIRNTEHCLGSNGTLPIMNEKVLEMKQTTKNQYLTRAHVEGIVVDIYPDKNGHRHFSLQIGKTDKDSIEVIYNEDFGALPDIIKTGMKVEACGDYITSIAPANGYPASPDGAILHWVHMNPRDNGHLPGYVEIDGRMFGQSYRR